MKVRTLALWFLSACVGCGPPGPRPETASDRPADAQALLKTIRARAESFDTLRMGLQLTWIHDATLEEESVGLALSYMRPGRIRAKATAAAFFTAFDLVVGSSEVWLDVPREGFTVVGPRENPSWNELPISPDHLLVALLSDPCPGKVCGEVLLEERADAYLLTAPAWSMEIDRRTQLPLRYERHRDSGGFIVTWSDWAVRQGVPWPHEATIRLPERAGRARIRLARLKVGVDLSESLFGFDPPDDREILDPQSAVQRWNRLIPAL